MWSGQEAADSDVFSSVTAVTLPPARNLPPPLAGQPEDGDCIHTRWLSGVRQDVAKRIQPR